MNELQKLGPSLNSDAKEIQEYIATINWELSEGNIDPAKALIYASKAIKFFQGIKDHAKLLAVGKVNKDNIFSSKLSQATTPATWDFSGCGDPILDRLVLDTKERKEFLRTLKKPTEVTDPETGEVSWVNPPIKTEGSHYIKVEII